VTTSTAAPDRLTPPPRKVPLRTRVDFWLDTTLLVAFTLDYSFRFTGLTVHEWIGIGLGFALIVHVTLHWDWVLRTTRKLLGRYAGREKLRWAVDLLLIGAMTLCIGSGILISRSALRALGLDTVRDPFWTGLHTTSADVCVLLVGVHVALSWRWVDAVARRLVGPRTRVPKAAR
jgi:hypothetical protein